jgi:uncharacterized MAPEG superfamily protein
MSGELNLALLAPAAVLALWTMLMMMWMAGTRLPAMSKIGTDLKTAKPGGRGVDLEGVIPDKVQWKAHNYVHLVEQPTVFYVVILILFVGGGTTTLTVGLAWAYTALRIIHSLWQSLVNTIPLRFTLFFISSLCLTALAVRAVILTLA